MKSIFGVSWNVINIHGYQPKREGGGGKGSEEGQLGTAESIAHKHSRKPADRQGKDREKEGGPDTGLCMLDSHEPG